MLEPTRVHAASCQSIAGRVPQHVNVERERKLGRSASTLDHAPDTGPTERLAALVDEHVGTLDAISLLLPL